ncbi:OsmC family protein [Sediminibacterium soli]|uniref:OsmC family protein n=1 Tax=Sediminibacterium soli TaxID=2698829 RepID=UPI00137AC15C|nr:OsmC family protein [Sediminibacterium soli]NCI48106.1 OsmC family protein [Sediminibacterium soli]
MPRITIKRTDNAFAFEAVDENSHKIVMDAAESFGGHNGGFRPMQTLLAGLGGCGGVDIISILKKQKQEVTDFHMEIEGEREQGKEPALWKQVHILFRFAGGIDEDKARKACSLSLDKYCSVAATLRAAGCTITWDLTIN